MLRERRQLSPACTMSPRADLEVRPAGALREALGLECEIEPSTSRAINRALDGPLPRRDRIEVPVLGAMLGEYARERWLSERRSTARAS